MSTERLIIELDARTAKLDAKLAATDRKLDKMDGSVKRTDMSLKSFGKSAMKARGAVLALGAVLGVGVFTRYADQIQMAENQLKYYCDKHLNSETSKNLFGVIISEIEKG